MDVFKPISVTFLSSGDVPGAPKPDTRRNMVRLPDIEIRYYLREEPFGKPEHIGYGVTVEVCSQDAVTERSDVSDVTCDKQRMLELIETLSRNSVTPVTLMDVIEDSLD